MESAWCGTGLGGSGRVSCGVGRMQRCREFGEAEQERKGEFLVECATQTKAGSGNEKLYPRGNEKSPD